MRYWLDFDPPPADRAAETLREEIARRQRELGEERAKAGMEYLNSVNERLRVSECKAAQVDPDFGITVALAIQVDSWPRRG